MFLTDANKITFILYRESVQYFESKERRATLLQLLFLPRTVLSDHYEPFGAGIKSPPPTNLMAIRPFKGLTARYIYMSFGAKGLNVTLFNFPWLVPK